MQTKLVILASIFGIITGLSFSTNQSILLSVGTALIASSFGIAAYFSKDKKDKQIEEIHSIATKKELPRQVQLPPLQEDILHYLYEKEYVSQIRINLALHTERETVTENLEALELIRMVSGQKLNKKLNIPDWRIERRGSEYLLNKGIVKK